MNKYYHPKHAVLFFLLSLLVFKSSFCQKVSDILENGITIKDGQAVILKYENGKFTFDIATKPSNNFDPYKNNTYFLVKGRGVNSFLAPPLNPINFSIGSEITFTPDEINKSFADALSAIIESIGKLQPGTVPTVKANPTPKPGKPVKDTPTISKYFADSTCIYKFLECKKKLDNVAKLLKDSRIKDLKSIFKKLQTENFTDKVVVDTSIAVANRDYKVVADYYESISKEIEKTENEIKEYNECTPAVSENFIYVYVLKQILKDESTVLNDYNKYLKNIKNVIELVVNTRNTCIGDGKDWYLPINRVSLENDKIGNASITIYDDGYTVSEEGIIIKKSKKALESINLKFRKFQRLIPEVSAGIAYTNLVFTKYDVDTDINSGKKKIIEAGEDKIRNLNFTTMINFVYYTPNSFVHPFWQLGIGANAGYPTLLTGIGGRINAPTLKRMALSVGFAGTWVKTLSTLKVGGEVTDAAELEKDLKYAFSFPLKPYLGIQINF